jgi:hypothetical protein
MTEEHRNHVFEIDVPVSVRYDQMNLTLVLILSIHRMEKGGAMLALGEVAPEEFTYFDVACTDYEAGERFRADLWIDRRDGSLWRRVAWDPTSIELMDIPMPNSMREMFRRLAQGRADWQEPVAYMNDLEQPHDL